MKLNLTVISLVLVAAVSFGLYQLSYEVQELEKDLKGLNKGISENKESVRILKAEWTYQNRPDVLQALSSKHLPLLLIAPYQVASVGEVPYPQVDPEQYSVPVPRHNPRRDYSPATPLPKGPIQLATFTYEGNMQ
ncbi:hypothetical protein [Sneathiella sp. HT1-7]|uniref:cell division protein FtsL n=1 Tax=Sneathiella sp. HT1-7 TaxID=2887192 RepID=UPI001D14989F|nr:hypothetical protein [Sneathiella sp. HT1-7]MCC3306649.1 hypothetical protein [Sneathiella sp. HT1-7]